jgi:hypothetical protein
MSSQPSCDETQSHAIRSGGAGGHCYGDIRRCTAGDSSGTHRRRTVGGGVEQRVRRAAQLSAGVFRV